MKAMKFTSLLIVALALTIGATGCKRKPVGVTPIPGTGTRVTDSGMRGIDDGNTIRSTDPLDNPLNPNLQNIDNYNQDRAALAVNTVRFDFDSSVVRSSEKANVEAVANYMKSAPGGVALLVEGHTDERGTEEYNRALGERRALALREELVANGVDGMKVTTRTFGEDRPVASGHDESAWSQNRRGEFVVLHPK
jgi:peptidoglycan-associated lipoprotein